MRLARLSAPRFRRWAPSSIISDLTQRGNLPLLRRPLREDAGSLMQIDAATRRNLELTQALSGGREGSLLHAIDLTVTAGGARLLERRISAPSRDLTQIHARHESVRFLLEQSRFSEDLRADLRRCPDMDRALSRLALDRGGPRDMAAIRNGLAQALTISERLSSSDAPTLLREAAQALVGHDELVALLDAALVAEPPLLARDGGFIAPGYHEELDQTRQLRDEGRGVIARMQADYIEATGIPSLKIKHNNVLGYFIETTATHAEKMLAPPLAERFIHRQTTANQVRFTTLELSELETRILNAGNHALEIEKRLYDSLKGAILQAAGPDRSCLSRAGRNRPRHRLRRPCRRRGLGRAAGRCLPRLRDRGRAPSGGRGQPETRGRALHRQ